MTPTRLKSGGLRCHFIRKQKEKQLCFSFFVAVDKNDYVCLISLISFSISDNGNSVIAEISSVE